MRMRIDIIPELQGRLYHELAVQDPRPTPARYVNDALEVALKRDKANREAAALRLRAREGEGDA